MDDNNSDYKFRMITHEAYKIKSLSQLLYMCLPMLHFKCTPRGMFLQQPDTHDNLLIDIKLQHFKKYKCYETLNIGIHPTYFQKLLRVVKKKDALEFFITKSEPDFFCIRYHTSKNIDKNNSSVVKIKIQSFEQVPQAQIPPYNDQSIMVTSSEFSKTLKSIKDISKNVKIIGNSESWIYLLCDEYEIFSREDIFGDADDFCQDKPIMNKCLKELNNSDDNNIENGLFPDTWYVQTFTTSCLNKFVKISGLDENLQIRAHKNMPLYIHSRVGHIGTIDIYVNSLELQQEMERINNTDSDIPGELADYLASTAASSTTQ
jgi:hypothetical protein